MYNFVYINTHDTGRMISPYGYDVPTDSLKQLAKEGTLFTHAYCCGPTCSPSRAAMLTGVYPHQNGMYGLAQRGFSLNDPKKHLAYYLKSKGYQTVLSGIQHEVGWYLDIEENKLHDIGYDTILTTESKQYAKEDLHLWDRENALKVLQWLDQADLSKPFMLAYGMHSTHRPYPFEVADNIDERYVKPPFPGESNPGNRHDQALYLTSAQNADSNVKLLLDKLKEKDLLDKTVVMFTTDHGLALPYHKCNLKDSGIGISLIIKHPTSGHGEVCDSLVSHIDIFPTVCDLLGLEKPEGLEGLSFAKTFEDVYHKHRDEIFAQVNFHTSYEPTRCIRNERYKYIRYYDESWNKINLSNIDESKPKDFLLEHGLSTLEKPTEALYDCYFDPNEANNLIAEPGLKEVVEDLRTKLFEQMEKTCDPLLKGEIEFKPHYKVNKKHCVKASSKNPDDYDPRGRWV